MILAAMAMKIEELIQPITRAFSRAILAAPLVRASQPWSLS